MRYKHIIWDWNGTLLNDVQQCVSTVNVLLKKRNLPELILNHYLDDVDFPIIDFYIKLGFDFDKERYEDIAHEYMDLYLSKLPQFQLQDNAVDVLTTIQDMGCTQSVLSAYQQDRLDEVIDYFDLRNFFLKIIGLDNYFAHSKVENGQQWIEDLPYDKKEVLFVGDMLHDFEVATAMGVDCVLLSCGHQSAKRLESCNVPVLSTIEELPGWLLK